MFNKLTLLLLFIICGLYFQNCKTDPLKEMEEMQESSVTYTADLKTIIENNCIVCHSFDGTFHTDPYLTSYALVKEATENNNLIARINSSNNPMPQSGLMSSNDRAKFDQWVTDGLLE